VASLLAEDLGRFTTGGMHDELTSWTPVAVHACRILNAAGGVVFVTPDQLVGARTIVHHAEQDGLRLVVVPHDVAAKLARLVDLDGNAMRDLRQFGREWDQSFSFTFVAPEKLTAAERRVYSLTSEVLRLAGLGPKRRLVKEVTISETMRISDRDQEMLGLWEPALGRIVVRRSQLRSRVAYAATLLHELGHVQSGAGDVTWEFEDGLTGLLGTISQPALRR
jgi:hypothetical protein